MTDPAPQISPGRAPVFFDATGNRWRRILSLVFAGLLLVVLSIVAILPAATAPVRPAQQNQAVAYPRQLLNLQDLESIPRIGPDKGLATFHRIAVVERVDGKTLLEDPFSDAVWREATPDETLLIGASPYVVEAYGLPLERTLMLTFDDGPDPTYTPEILDLLSREGVPATFFSVGDNVVKYPDLLRRIVREGHMVGNHSESHIDFWSHDDVYNRQQIIGMDRIMRAVSNYESRLFRIPTGDPENNTLALLLSQQLGYLHVSFDLDTRDWEHGPAESIALPELSGPGHVVLVHDGGGDRTATIDMLKEFIPQAKAQGYTFTTLQPLLPPEFVPQHNVPASIEDNVTLAALTSYLVTPNVLLTWLFWFGIGSLTILTFLFVILALVNNSRQKKRQWDEVKETEWPFVSVVLPVYNEELVVAKTLDALRASDYPLMEVVAVNDGSTDGTLAVLTEYATTWAALRVINQPNGGKSAASNHGIDESCGQVVVTLDGDTLFEPQTIKMFARHFLAPRSGKEVGAVAGHVKVGNRQNLITAWQSLEYLSGICVTRMAEGLMGAISIVPGACAAWRREALVRAGGYSHDTMAEDADLTLSLQRLGYSIVQENQAVAWTEAPLTVRGLFKQRLRWTYGNIQTLYKHRAMIFNPKYGALGMLSMPYALISVLVPLVFMPLTVVVAVISLTHGEWQAIAIFSAFVAATHMLISIVAVLMVHENLLHLLMVPAYRLIYEPLRAYVVFGSAIQALRGSAVGWYRPARTNSVDLSEASGKLRSLAPSST
ncbi:bifunctional polysaccharide deacetylase/glycosyltransferase family 2 protein [Arthrobacter sp. P2b]|uniref:bifunctional polysaccharide deacetylase/glycosyltransferase family 2 protein n=1 Tax=Arthrobacter sp. P2b TaxID=1938741 RepID=UPI0009A893BE|nr:bifunctional polysaccharide deacetylase/glycosyltransferase family 2 protein [Arthrobacter sp. P2b]SLK13840.1 biofilm PGA synthesis N-glycosyltransferase PgaC [Arthrobacter sp. P2b]